MAAEGSGNRRRARPSAEQAAAYAERAVTQTALFQASAIEDYAIIGDCRTAALVSRTGSIDWLCWPRFDSPACFAALLGTPQNGYWRIAPVEPTTRITRRYLPGTMILETLFETASGSVALIDFMAIERNSVIRIVEGRSGSVPMALDLSLRFAYGSAEPWVTRLNHGSGIRAIAGPDLVLLKSDVKLHGRALTSVAQFTAEPGARTRFCMVYGPSYEPDPKLPDADAELADAEAVWTAWSSRGSYRGTYREAVQRSLMTLKVLSYHPTGGIVAAPTTSLPERFGGARNWDYRYCWLRDATFTLLALIHCGYREEAQAWGAWLRRSVAGSPDQLQTLYGIRGERWVQEWEVPWLSGYQGAKPVRIGNAASTQLQLDVYGELMDALFHETNQGLAPPAKSWDLARTLVLHLERIWDQPDESIWEVRGEARQFTFSKVMAWVAFDRAVRAAETFNLPAPLDRWRALRDRIHALVCEEGFNKGLGSFTQFFGGDVLDASLLLMPLVGFLPADDPRMVSTVAAIGRDLMHNGLIRRYHTSEADDGLTGDEGVFLACSFWYVDNLCLQGRTDEARAMFERLLGLCNDVGLLSEEYDPIARRQLGNFPQAFSHLALINSALNLDTAMGPGTLRSQGGD
ncbi:MAG TPA: glycoside hydrolase family 15 protein [Rhodopila sp.]|uniref:glycoside hydrolase family 15 protein n=1 Tax=Rhodopila sp. TaxID=2480087 RepID=UPI002C243306|nr:glycoside hydrolase family 15 protein [Rhodopila sp.]HVY16383.1 glycoside hydrolase family 15 protein [Rhodopila sp.]